MIDFVVDLVEEHVDLGNVLNEISNASSLRMLHN